MVNFSQTDFKILLTMTVFLIFVSFVFPPLGFTSDSVNASEIPEFNLSQGQFEYMESTVETPGQPNQGTLTYEEGATQYKDERTRFIADDVSIATYNQNTPENPDILLVLTDFRDDDVNPNSTERTITEGEYVLINNYSFSVSFDNLQFEDSGSNYTVDWEVHERPEGNGGGGWIDAIPIVGGLVSAGSDLASSILWIGSIISVAITNALLTVGNVFISLFNVLGFFFDFMYWLLTTYGSVVAGSPNAWVSVFMAIPAVVLSFQFGKLVILLLQTILRGIPLT